MDCKFRTGDRVQAKHDELFDVRMGDTGTILYAYISTSGRKITAVQWVRYIGGHECSMYGPGGKEGYCSYVCEENLLLIRHADPDDEINVSQPLEEVL